MTVVDQHSDHQRRAFDLDLQTNDTFVTSRTLNVPGVTNLRDVGGYPAANRALTRWGTLLRSGTMNGLKPEQAEPLERIGLRTIIDLRRPSEIRNDPQPQLISASGAASYHNISLLTDDIEQARKENNYLLPDIYRAMIDHAQAEVAETISILAEPEAFPALVRCTAGKDRTGIIIALLLRVAGVPDDTIVYDYALSQKSMETEEFINFQQAHILARGNDWDHYQRNFLISPADFMRDALAHIDTGYGSASGYLQEIGIDVATMNHLRTTLVQPRTR
jgi:protein-tyrosine phosphatase